MGDITCQKKGYCDLRSAIRKEWKETLDLVIPIITALTGVFGALIGLIAMAKK